MDMLRSEGVVYATDDLYLLAYKPNHRVLIYPACIVNGLRFTIKE